jgi:ABC-type polysaccharide/polyol phosphate export permease
VQDSSLPDWAQTLYKANPMVGFVDIFRDLLYNLQFPDWWQVLYVTVWSVGILFVALRSSASSSPGWRRSSDG